MKIRLRHDVPVAKKHGLTEGRVLDVIEDDGMPRVDVGRDIAGVWIMGDAGEPVKVLGHEYEIVDE